MSIHGSPHEEEVVGPSDRSFGLVFTAVFTIVALLPLWRGASPRWWAVAVAAVFGALALLWPPALAPANRVWLRIGLLMHRIVNPVVMGAIFYLVVTPFGLAMRLLGKGPAAMRRGDTASATYWISRSGGSSPMDRQF
jgi:hypothetical protein